MTKDPAFHSVVQKLFSDPERHIRVAAGDLLLKAGSRNDKLYLILSGHMKGLVPDSEGRLLTIFESYENDLVGFHSFFSKSFVSLADVQAVCDTDLAYVEASQLETMRQEGTYLFETFLPIIAREFISRHNHMKELVIERERTFQHLIQTEKLASLGQMAAGIAHELNNAIAVLQRNTEWVSKELPNLISRTCPEANPFYLKGLDRGRQLSGMEIRKERKEWLKHHQKLEPDSISQAIELGINKEQMNEITKELVSKLHDYWELGSVFHDMRLASQQAVHVVQSVKTLGARTGQVRKKRNLNESIQEALSLLRSKLRSIEVRLNLAPLPAIMANAGEWVQVWTNLIQNACDSMLSQSETPPFICISSHLEDDRIVVSIEDNGPGIPDDIQPRIFQPHVTTKVEGLSFGLGLGLTIVNRIVESYFGTIQVASEPGKTVFTLQIPIGGENE